MYGRNPEPDHISLPENQQKFSGRMIGLSFGAVLLAYIAISTCSIRAPFFALDDWDELNLVRSTGSWLSLLGSDLYHFFRPIKNLMFAVYNWLYTHGGIVPVRVMAIAIGVLSASAVFKLCCRLLVDRRWAVVATAIWLLSPTLVSSTAWLSASNILLMTGLAAAALTFHDMAGECEEFTAGSAKMTGTIWSVFAVLFLFLALFSYEGALSVVALFFAMDWYLHPERLRRFSTWRRYIFYGLALFIYMFLRHEAQSTQTVHGGFSGVSRLEAAISAGYLTVLHTSIWLWPFNRMAVIGGYYWGQVSKLELVACYLLVLAAVVFSILWRRRYPYVALGILWFLLAFAPMSNVLGFRNGPYCDSYIALASVGAAIAFAAILRALWPLRMTGSARVAALVVIALLIASRLAAAFEAASWSYAWNDPMVAYERSLQTFPQAFDAMTELAKLYEARGEFSKADELAKKSIEIAPDRSGPYAVRAVVAEHDGRIQDALKWLELYNNFGQGQTGAWALTFEGDIYANHLGQPERAEEYYRQALARSPWSQDSLRAAYELAYMEAKQDHRTEAISLWEKLLVYHPDDGVLHWDLAVAYRQQGDQARAAYHLRLAQGLSQQSSNQTTNENKLQ